MAYRCGSRLILSAFGLVDGSLSNAGRTPGFVRSALVERDAYERTHSVEIDVGSEQARSMPKGDGCDHAIDHPSWGDADSPARPVDPSGGIEVHGGIEAQQDESLHEPAEVLLPFLITRTGKHLHDHRFGDRDIVAFSDQ